MFEIVVAGITWIFPTDYSNLLIRQPVQFIYQLIYLAVNGINLTLDEGLVMAGFGVG